MLKQQPRQLHQNSKSRLFLKNLKHLCQQTLVVLNLTTSNTSRVKMIRMNQSPHLKKNLQTKKLSKNREVVHPKLNNSQQKIVLLGEGMELADNLLRRKTKIAMTKKMLNSQRKRVRKMIIKIAAIFVRKQVVFFVVMAALKQHTLHALVSRNHLKEIGIALIALKSSQGKEQLVDRRLCS